MARRKKSGSGGAVGVLVIGAIAALAAIPKEVWIAGGALAVVGLAIYAYSQMKGSPTSRAIVPEEAPRRQSSKATSRQVSASPPPPRASAERSAGDNSSARAQLPARPSQLVAALPSNTSTTVLAAPSAPRRPPPAPTASPLIDEQVPVSVVPAAPQAPSAFRVPPAPKGFGAATWIPASQSAVVAGLTIPGGMVYVGTSLKTPLGNNDPCLIDPSKSVAARGDYTARQTDYWPSYSEISPSARRAYLNWLASGRNDPDADIGYVFLFFYGLERRAIIDASADEAARADWPIIAEEVRRLLAVYGGGSGSFRRYASELLDWVSLATYPVNLYEQPVPSFPKTFELPLYLRLALGQASLDGAPVPAPLALAWASLDPNTFLRTPATRCEEQFAQLFLQTYADIFGAGMVLPRNRTKLKLVYRPASAAFQGYEELCLTFGDTPDVTVLTAPLKELHRVIELATEKLDPYSRFVGKNPDSKTSLEALLLLPRTLWPPNAQAALQAIKGRVNGGILVMPFQELLAALDAKSSLTKERIQALARTLESMDIGIEPDVLYGAKAPKLDDDVVLFALSAGETRAHSAPAYRAAMLTLQLASAVAAADGEFSPKEMSHLDDQIRSWTHLQSDHSSRLMAHLRLLALRPVTLTALKQKLEPLDASARKIVATFMATVAQSDGTVSAAEIKMLEKVYKALGVEPKKVFGDLHAVASGTTAMSAVAAKEREAGFTLDQARIVALQQDTEKVSALLSSIFAEEPDLVVQAPEPDGDAETAEAPRGLLGLDEAHSAFVRMLLSRPAWSRDELLAVAADLDLMLDGALEHINEASFDAHAVALTEGDDPVTVSSEILEKIDP